MPRTYLLAAALAAALPLGAVAQDVRVYTPAPSQWRMLSTTADRPMLGVTPATQSARGDTLGLLIEEVRSDSPADKAGIKEGDRLQSINGVNLRADRADAGEDDYDGALLRRLQREMAKVEEGDTVSLRVYSDGRTRDVRVVPVAMETMYASSLGGMTARIRNDRAVLGLSTGTSPSPRDTLGVFVQSVTGDGPAAKAGIIEGDRIASINGVSLRVARADVDDPMIANAKEERLRTELGKLTAGEVAELVVISAGRSRTVRVTTVKASELPGYGNVFELTPAIRGTLERMRAPEGVQFFTPTPPTPPTPPVAPVAPRATRLRSKVILI